MHKNAMKCNKTLSKWCKNKLGASKIIDTFETYHIAYDNVFVDGRNSTQHPVYRKFICHPVDLVGEAP
jgi:hypothetical protein